MVQKLQSLDLNPQSSDSQIFQNGRRALYSFGHNDWSNYFAIMGMMKMGNIMSSTEFKPTHLSRSSVLTSSNTIAPWCNHRVHPYISMWFIAGSHQYGITVPQIIFWIILLTTPLTPGLCFVELRKCQLWMTPKQRDVIYYTKVGAPFMHLRLYLRCISVVLVNRFYTVVV